MPRSILLRPKSSLDTQGRKNSFQPLLSRYRCSPVTEAASTPSWGLSSELGIHKRFSNNLPKLPGPFCSWQQVEARGAGCGHQVERGKWSTKEWTCPTTHTLVKNEALSNKPSHAQLRTSTCWMARKGPRSLEQPRSTPATSHPPNTCGSSLSWTSPPLSHLTSHSVICKSCHLYLQNTSRIQLVLITSITSTLVTVTS